MSKLAIALLVIGVAAMPFVDTEEKAAALPVAYGGTAAAAPLVERQTVYIVKSSTGSSCQMVSAKEDSKTMIVRPDVDCAKVASGLERVTKWVAGENGHDLLVDASGAVVMVLGPSDGFAYEAVTNDGAQISFALSGV
ncbi:MAG: hypothetical protein ACRCU5_07605 [Rhizobiaceae bacterium]